MSLKPLKVVISGGGTGGHIFPAIAIADAIRAKAPDAMILFVGAEGRMEMHKVPEAGYAITGLKISGIQRKMTASNLLFPFKLIRSLFKARSILKTFKPDVVVGVGGYASGPTLRMAINLGIKTLIQEQNSFPGITNRLLGKKANRICVAYDNMDQWFPKEKTTLSGNPMRLTAINTAGKKQEALNYFNLTHDKQIILIVGGSQGAKAINEAISNSISAFANASIQMIWQTGEAFLPLARQAISDGMESSIHPHAFINRMDLAYAAADIVVSRAGAMSISELSMVAKPTIFIPLPTAAEDHQSKNAMRLVEKKAAILVKNNEAFEKLCTEIIKLANDKALQEELAANINLFAQPNATEIIVNQIFELAGR